MTLGSTPLDHDLYIHSSDVHVITYHPPQPLIAYFEEGSSMRIIIMPNLHRLEVTSYAKCM